MMAPAMGLAIMSRNQAKGSFSVNFTVERSVASIGDGAEPIRVRRPARGPGGRQEAQIDAISLWG
jgi:hypothetical protein